VSIGFAVSLTAALPAPAQTPPPMDGDGPAAAGAEASGGATEIYVEDPNDPAYIIGRLIRCPVCQGMSIADSPSEMAQSMMKQVRAMHADGSSREEIFAFFTKAYGDWVLLAPPAEGINWLVWVLPPLGLLLAIFGIRAYMRWTESAVPGPAQAPESSSDDDGDAYLRLIRDEVDR
jgi:cytochrome c-type biogenesis protein CcmH